MEAIGVTKAFDPAALKIGRAYRVGLVAHIEAGRLLAAKKAELKHGEWLPWLKANAGALDFTDASTASRLMKLAAKNPALTHDLPEAEAKEITRKVWGNVVRPEPTPPNGNSLIKSVEVNQRSEKVIHIPIITAHDTTVVVAFINKHHARRDAALNNKLALVGLINEFGHLLGAALLSRPAGGDGSDWTTTAELSRLCVRHDCDVPNGCSILITEVARIAKAWGFRQIKTFTELDETGVSYKSAGWRDDGLTEPGRDGEPKRRWLKDFEPDWRKSKRPSNGVSKNDTSIRGSVREIDTDVMAL